MKTVGIIGGGGFIGSYVTRLFLKNGFDVKISTTTITKDEKYKHLLQLENADKLQISELNVEDKSKLEEFAQGCEIIIHGGTPFQLNVEDPNRDLFQPTIKGTENFLEAISNTPGVKKVVLIASVAAWNTNFPFPPDGKTFSDPIDETAVRFTSKESHPYGQAKFLAHQTVEKFISENPNIQFEISSVSPVMVMGKSLSARKDSTSGGLQSLLKNNIAPDAFFQTMYDKDIPLSIVDVEDVANAIFKLATTHGLHGKDYLLSGKSYPVSDVHLMLNLKNPKTGGQSLYKNDLAKLDLAVAFRPVQETLSNFTT